MEFPHTTILRQENYQNDQNGIEAAYLAFGSKL